MSYPDVFLYCWINMSDQILNPNFLEQGLQKDLGKIGKCILTQSRYSSSTNFSNRISNHNGALQFDSHTQYIFVPICQKNLWLLHCILWDVILLSLSTLLTELGFVKRVWNLFFICFLILHLKGHWTNFTIFWKLANNVLYAKVRW